MWFNDVGIKKWFPIKLNTRNSEIGVKGMLFKVRSKDEPIQMKSNSQICIYFNHRIKKYKI